MTEAQCRQARDFWLDSARRMKVQRDASAGDPTPEFCLNRARLFHRTLLSIRRQNKDG